MASSPTGNRLIIVADQDLPLLERTFGQHGTLQLRPGREISPADLRDADALVVRSITRVGAGLLRHSPVRFVGTATIGLDHLDTEWLRANGIHWAGAPGCNATAAAQYSLAMILLALQRCGRNFEGLSAGIIGRGNVGSRVQGLLYSLGVDCVACDPPLKDQGVGGLVPLEQALNNDLVCLHVPLTRRGPYPTWRMLDARTLAMIPNQALLLNTARGDVIDGSALRQELEDGRLHAALDVWPGEPRLDSRLLELCRVATPHVAGYSEQGRQAGILTVYGAFCRWSGLRGKDPGNLVPPTRELSVGAGAQAVCEAVTVATRVAVDDRALRAAASSPDITAAFDALRRNYPARQEFQHWHISGADDKDRATLAALGFQTA
jgi:erythronate-4-phosphate dehydrogenase